MIVTEYENKGRDYRKLWFESFFETIDVSNHNRTNFLWEWFHTQNIPFRKGKEANQAFEKVNKQYCFIFFQESNDVLKVEYASEMKAKDLCNEVGEYSDVYIVDKGFNWTYVVPHEKEEYGPYFYRK